MLASQGFNVVKIASINASHPKKMTVKNKTDRKLHPAISNRKHEIAIFVEGLESLYQNLERIMDGVQDYLIKSENEHGRLIEEASAFYKALEEII
jgi:CRISPR/Cas system CSM-associated protein Csm2 small subunit